MEKINLYVTLIASVISLSACTNHIGGVGEEPEKTGKERLSFQVGYGVSQDPMARGEAQLSDYISAIKLYDYKDGALHNEVSQSSGDSGFGRIEAEMEHGTHELLFVGHNSDSCAYDAATSTLSFFDRVLDTFTYYTTLDVTGDTPSQEITLDRQVAQLKLYMCDTIPEEADNISISVDGYSDRLNGKSGVGENRYNHIRVWKYGAENIGETGTSYYLYSFMPEAGKDTVTVTVMLNNADGEAIRRQELDGVPLKKNTRTTISGYLFRNTPGANIVIASQWEEVSYPVP